MIAAARTSACAAIVFAICDAACGTDVQSTNDWYRPEPPPVPLENSPLILPATTSRPVSPIPLATQKTAISMLAKTAIFRLTPSEWRELKIPISPSDLLEKLISRKEGEGTESEVYIPGLGPGKMHWPNRAGKEAADNWKSLKECLHPYLIRAVAADGDESKFFADVWHDVLTITHSSVVEGNLANDPLRQHASILFNPKDVHSIKSPVIVYLEREPKSIFTELQIVKAGR